MIRETIKKAIRALAAKIAPVSYYSPHPATWRDETRCVSCGQKLSESGAQFRSTGEKP